MSAFLIRSSLVLALFLSGAFVGGVTGKYFLAAAVWFTAISTWTLFLGFRKALWIILPFLVIADILWDGTLGSVFFSGFLLAVATTYLAVRIEDHSPLLQTAIRGFLISFCGTLAVVGPSFWHQSILSLEEIRIMGNVFCWLLITTTVFLFPVRGLVQRVEGWLDMSHREQIRKIR